ncbi:bifunctional DNA-formamidopyrimidine glycosylase/DNA-(apurinic or apyrimidinic site) lyase [Candidatus Parcubacteria bacterium]|nr:MAG: bifunctional DNA-formamidopyrimidine glycosylase/DNA-(apurinic or apyrimidinic site) lyase [Candidatus Parcubacteria bacterium]
MPELPEVETIVNDLQKILPGLKLLDVLTDAKNLFRKNKFEDFKKKVVGEKILNLSRKGKNILIHLSGNTTILIHQKMTGHLLYGKWVLETPPSGASWKSAEEGPIKDDPMNRFIHIVFRLSNGKELALSDMRKFAKVIAWPTDKLSELADVKLGMDPFDKNFTLKKFKELLASKKRGKIKSILMDQTLIAGIGNIYSDEILWLAGVNPLKDISELSDGEMEKIYKAIRPVLERAIKARGTSASDYRDPMGRKGKYQEMQYAYRLTGKPCQKNDGGTIARVKIGGRSAHYCPVHQRI